MLESILLKGVASYDATGISLDGLRKINFIYGANGCGKTTFSRLIHDPSDEAYGDCSLKWKGGLPVKVLTYNKDFRDKNFGNGKIAGVFTLGEATKEQIEAIEAMQKELAEVTKKVIEKKATLSGQETLQATVEDDFKDVVWHDIYKENEIAFKNVFRGFMRKDAFKEKIVYEFENNNEPLLSLEELLDRSKTIFGEVPTRQDLIPGVDFTKLSELEQNKIWNQKIIGKADVSIGAMIQRLNLNDWVNEGRAYIDGSGTCPFCQQETITESFKKQLERYFDESFTESIELVKRLSQDYIRISDNILRSLEYIETNHKNDPNSELDLDVFTTLLKTLSSQIANNKSLLVSKEKEPSRSIELTSTTEQLVDINTLIDDANKIIKRHNDLVNDFSNQKAILIKSVWKYLVEGHAATIRTSVARQRGITRGIDLLKKQKQELNDRYLNLKEDIRQANKHVTSVQPSVDEINRILKSYGFLNFEIVPSQADANQYQIQREDGVLAESTLSEGEATFITFLYYLQLAKGSTDENSVSEERILVIDDPICSLDSNILFVVSSLIKEIIKSVKNDTGIVRQLILLTHNVYFHKEVSFIDGRTSKNADTHFWIIRKNRNVSQVESFGMDNPIQSSYELLWRELRDSSKNSGITIQNTMRRIIENYFKILGSSINEEIIKSFDTIQEQEICRSLICWINDGSHGLPDDLFIERQDAIVDRYLDVFKQIFIKTGHEQHFVMMYRDPKASGMLSEAANVGKMGVNLN